MKYLIFLVLILPFSNHLKAQIRYVKPVATGTGDGSSWANASANIQNMLDAAGVDEVWVATGTYKPLGYPTGCTDCSGTRDYAFLIPADKKLIGGFAGTETQKLQRNIAANETILSGDIGTTGVTSDNTYHVIIAPFEFGDLFSIELDGFTIVNGNNAGSSGYITVNGRQLYRSSGAGAYFPYCSRTITNCHFENNIAGGVAGALYAYGSGLNLSSISNCSFLMNHAFHGGAIYGGGGLTEFTDCVIDQNEADSLGGGLYLGGEFILSYSNITNNHAGARGGGLYGDFVFPLGKVEHCRFENNTADVYGGGILTYYGNYEFNGNTLINNTSTNGGGLYCWDGDITVRDNLFQSNVSDTYSGGGAFFTQNDHVLVERNYFVSNTGKTGGGLGASGTTTLIQNNVFLSNYAGYYGGGVIFLSGTNVLTNNTFVDNGAPAYGGGLYTLNGTNLMRNNIFWKNKYGSHTNVAGADYRNYQATNTFKYNDMQFPSAIYSTDATGNYHLGTGASGNLFGVDPQFMDMTDIDGADGILRNEDDGLAIPTGSPMKNAGDTTSAPSDDIRALTREGKPDIGAYEFILNTCPEVVQVTGTINSNQKADQSIVTLSPNNIQAGTSVTYQAGNYIQLNPGFSTGTNSVFITKLLAGCQ